MFNFISLLLNTVVIVICWANYLNCVFEERDKKSMMHNKLVRGVDDIGRIAIPREFREQLNIQPGDNMELVITGENKIIIKSTSGADGCYLRDSKYLKKWETEGGLTFEKAKLSQNAEGTGDSREGGETPQNDR